MTVAVLTAEQLEHLVERAVERAVARVGRPAPEAMTSAQAAEQSEALGEMRPVAVERNQGKGTYAWTKKKEAVLFRASNRCEVCGYEGPLNIHHKVPRSKGGTDELDNLVALCPNHHAEAHEALRKQRKA